MTPTQTRSQVRENRCTACDGKGYIDILRDSSGKLDHINGKSDGETRTCHECNGEGSA